MNNLIWSNSYNLDIVYHVTKWTINYSYKALFEEWIILNVKDQGLSTMIRPKHWIHLSYFKSISSSSSSRKYDKSLKALWICSNANTIILQNVFELHSVNHYMTKYMLVIINTENNVVTTSKYVYITGTISSCFIFFIHSNRKRWTTKSNTYYLHNSRVRDIKLYDCFMS